MGDRMRAGGEDNRGRAKARYGGFRQGPLPSGGAGAGTGAGESAARNATSPVSARCARRTGLQRLELRLGAHPARGTSRRRRPTSRRRCREFIRRGRKADLPARDPAVAQPDARPETGPSRPLAAAQLNISRLYNTFVFPRLTTQASPTPPPLEYTDAQAEAGVAAGRELSDHCRIASHTRGTVDAHSIEPSGTTVLPTYDVEVCGETQYFDCSLGCPSIAPCGLTESDCV